MDIAWHGIISSFSNGTLYNLKKRKTCVDAALAAPLPISSARNLQPELSRSSVFLAAINPMYQMHPHLEMAYMEKRKKTEAFQGKVVVEST